MEKRTKPLILCVDDDEPTLDHFRSLLGEHGYEAAIAANGAAALEQAKVRTPDLVLLDLQMPGMDGLQVCAQLQEIEETSFVPVIVLSDQADEPLKARAVSLGAVDFLVRPFTKRALLDRIRMHVVTRTRWTQVRLGALGGAAPKGGTVRRAAPGAAPAKGGTIRKKAPLVAGDWEKRLRPTEFARFKESLCATLGLPDSARPRILQADAGEIYRVCADLGKSSRELSRAVAEFLDMPYVSYVKGKDIQLGTLPAAFCRLNEVVPILDDSGRKAFLVSNPFRAGLAGALKSVQEDRGMRLVITEPERIGLLLAYSPPKPGQGVVEEDLTSELRRAAPAKAGPEPEAIEDTTSVVRLVNRLVEKGREVGASDIHIEPREDEIAVRYRVDGDLHVAHRLKPGSLIRPIVARLKVMAQLKIEERRLPQNGRIVFSDFTDQPVKYDLRLSTIPTIHGEKVVMRILDKEKTVLPLESLGLSPGNLKAYREKLRAPWGLILHVGPTGSGKSMTLYAAVNELKDPTLNIVTAEDPVEYTLPGINQLQVHPDIGLTFAEAMRNFLRQDPDIILVGEMRDEETTRMAIEAGLTGHLVLSTLHTNDAASTVTRLLSMNVEPYLVSSSLLLICAQRLVRRLCVGCKERYRASAEEAALVGAGAGEEVFLHRARGCKACNGIGYKGRIGVHEVLVPDEQVRQAMCRKGITADEIKRLAVERCGMVTLHRDAMEKVRQGVCSIEDTLANVARDDAAAAPGEATRA